MSYEGVTRIDGVPGSHAPIPLEFADIAGSSCGALLPTGNVVDVVGTKVSCPERLTVSGPPGYADVRPFARTIVERFPDRVLWGTDWPHPNMKSHMPDDGVLLDLVPRIAPTEELRRKLLVDNPIRLYWAV